MHSDVCASWRRSCWVLLPLPDHPHPDPLLPGGLITLPQAFIPLYLPLREYHSICLYWSTLDCRRYRNPGFGTANNQQQHQRKMHEKHFILTFPQFNLCQPLCLKGASPWEQRDPYFMRKEHKSLCLRHKETVKQMHMWNSHFWFTSLAKKEMFEFFVFQREQSPLFNCEFISLRISKQHS